MTGTDKRTAARIPSWREIILRTMVALAAGAMSLWTSTGPHELPENLLGLINTVAWITFMGYQAGTVGALAMTRYEWRH